jgi:hypothetical protein
VGNRCAAQARCKGKRAYRRMYRYTASLGQHFHRTRDDRIFCN